MMPLFNKIISICVYIYVNLELRDKLWVGNIYLSLRKWVEEITQGETVQDASLSPDSVVEWEHKLLKDYWSEKKGGITKNFLNAIYGGSKNGCIWNTLRNMKHIKLY